MEKEVVFRGLDGLARGETLRKEAQSSSAEVLKRMKADPNYTKETGGAWDGITDYFDTSNVGKSSNFYDNLGSGAASFTGGLASGFGKSVKSITGWTPWLMGGLYGMATGKGWKAGASDAYDWMTERTGKALGLDALADWGDRVSETARDEYADLNGISDDPANDGYGDAWLRGGLNGLSLANGAGEAIGDVKGWGLGAGAALKGVKAVGMAGKGLAAIHRGAGVGSTMARGARVVGSGLAGMARAGGGKVVGAVGSVARPAAKAWNAVRHPLNTARGVAGRAWNAVRHPLNTFGGAAGRAVRGGTNQSVGIAKGVRDYFMHPLGGAKGLSPLRAVGKGAWHYVNPLINGSLVYGGMSEGLGRGNSLDKTRMWSREADEILKRRDAVGYGNGYGGQGSGYGGQSTYGTPGSRGRTYGNWATQEESDKFYHSMW